MEENKKENKIEREDITKYAHIRCYDCKVDGKWTHIEDGCWLVCECGGIHEI